MKKNKIALFALSLVAVAAVGVGSTLAYFTDKTEEKVNTITMGNVDIDFDEPNFDPDDDDDTVEDIVPGDVIVKDPTITVTDNSEDCYVRVKVEVTGTITDAQKADVMDSLYLNGVAVDETDVWYQADIDGASAYFYYKDMLVAGNVVTLFDTVEIPAEWGNDVASKSFDIVITAEAIQADNFTPEVANGKIVGWNGVEAETYVAPEAEVQQ